MTMELGCKGRAETVVTPEKTAKTAGSGALDVFATPFMAALMEEAAWTSIQPYLEDGQGSVGIALNLTHDAATPEGVGGEHRHRHQRPEGVLLHHRL